MLYKKIQLENKTIGIWKVTETQEELQSLVASDTLFLNELEGVHSEKRKREKLATHCLLKELCGDSFCLEYLPSGKPQLVESDDYVSISHSADYVAVALSKLPVGVDIQQKDGRVLSLKRRFVSADEYVDPRNEVTHLLLHWSAKEALFKWLGLSEISLTEQLHVKPFALAETGFFEMCETKTENQHVVQAYYEVETDFVLVVAGN